MTPSLYGLLTWLRQHPAYHKVRDAMREGVVLPTQGLLPHARPPLLAALVEDLNAPLLIIAPRIAGSRRMVEALRLWLTHKTQLLHFPEPSALFYERAPWATETITDRMDVLSTLYQYRQNPTAPPVIVTSVRALMQRTLPYRQFRKAARQLTTGARESLTGLARHAAGIGYAPESLVQAPGQFSRRGIGGYH